MIDRKEIRGFPNYFVTNTGHVISKNYNNTGVEKQLKIEIVKDGYARVALRSDENRKRNFRKFIHVLVLEHFGDPRPTPSSIVKHKNKNKLDNRIENLEWALRDITGMNHPQTFLFNYNVMDMRTDLMNGISRTDVAKKYGMTKNGVNGIAWGRTWRGIENFMQFKAIYLKVEPIPGHTVYDAFDDAISIAARLNTIVELNANGMELKITANDTVVDLKNQFDDWCKKESEKYKLKLEQEEVTNTTP